MNWTTASRPSANHLRRSEVTISSPFTFPFVGHACTLAAVTCYLQVLPSQQQVDALQCAHEKRYDQYCPVAHALDLVGERWSMLIVKELMHGPQRYTDLAEHLPGIGTNILAGRLRDLETCGVIAKRKLPPPAASRVYELTDYGRALQPVMRELALWGARSLGPPTDADELFDGWLANALDTMLGPFAPDGTLRVPRRRRGRRRSRTASAARPRRGSGRGRHRQARGPVPPADRAPGRGDRGRRRSRPLERLIRAASRGRAGSGRRLADEVAQRHSPAADWAGPTAPRYGRSQGVYTRQKLARHRQAVITGVHHFSLSVADVDRSMAFYRGSASSSSPIVRSTGDYVEVITGVPGADMRIIAPHRLRPQPRAAPVPPASRRRPRARFPGCRERPCLLADR